MLDPLAGRCLELIEVLLSQREQSTIRAARQSMAKGEMTPDLALHHWHAMDAIGSLRAMLRSQLAPKRVDNG